jgi:hypothetical protein
LPGSLDVHFLDVHFEPALDVHLEPGFRLPDRLRRDWLTFFPCSKHYVVPPSAKRTWRSYDHLPLRLARAELLLSALFQRMLVFTSPDRRGAV